MKILLIGPYPPPLGGVSVFVKRYKNRLEQENHQVEILDLTKSSRFSGFIRLCAVPFKRYDIIHVDIFLIKVYMLLFIFGIMNKVKIMDHSWREFEKWKPIQKRLFSALIGRCNKLILNGPGLKDYYKAHGVTLPQSTTVQSPFLPPPPEDETPIMVTYPPDLLSFINGRRPLLIANAYQLEFYNNVDLYGLDMLIELIFNLKKKYPDIGLLFALAEVGDLKYFDEINNKIDRLRIGENVYFLTGQKELWPLFKRADLMIRPTFSDGFGISVAEAIYFGCPAIASNVCQRPAGTVLFNNRDMGDLLNKVQGILNESSK